MLARRSDSFPSLLSMRDEFDRMFERFFEGKAPLFGDTAGAGAWLPAVDVTEEGDKVLVKAELPGIDPAKLDVAIQGDLLTLKGEKEESHEEKGRNFFRSERRFGSFMRRIPLPAPVDDSKVHATFKDGVLKVELQKHASVQPKKIAVSKS